MEMRLEILFAGSLLKLRMTMYIQDRKYTKT